MAGKLDDMIAPDERVVYRARRNLWEILWSFLGYAVCAAIITLIWLIFRWFTGLDVGDDNYPLYVGGGFILFFLMVFWGIDTGARISGMTAVVTDRRFLYTTGIFKPKVMEIPLADIERVTYAEVIPPISTVKIQLPTGKFVWPYFGRGSDGLCAAIKAQMGLPQPPKPPRKVVIWSYFVRFFRGLSGFAVMYMIMTGPLMSFIKPLETLLVAILFSFGVISLAFVGYGIARLVSGALALCLARNFFTADEAKQLVCLLSNARHFLPVDHWQSRLIRRRDRLAERYVSWLYGQPIRCEDDE